MAGDRRRRKLIAALWALALAARGDRSDLPRANSDSLYSLHARRDRVARDCGASQTWPSTKHRVERWSNRPAQRKKRSRQHSIAVAYAVYKFCSTFPLAAMSIVSRGKNIDQVETLVRLLHNPHCVHLPGGRSGRVG